MSTDMIETLARFVRTDAGRRWFESVDRATRAQQETVAERVELVAAIEETEPPLRAAVERADVQLAAARAAFEKAKRRRYETGIAAENLRDRARDDRRRARGRLRLTADPRLAPARRPRSGRRCPLSGRRSPPACWRCRRTAGG